MKQLDMKLSNHITTSRKFVVHQDYLRSQYLIVGSRQDTDALVAALREERFFHYRRVEGTRGQFTLTVHATRDSKRILQWYLAEVSFMELQEQFPTD